MSKQEPLKGSDGKQVSKARKIVSGIVLIGLLVVLGIEGRAGFGHSSAAKALQKMAPDGAFEPGFVTEEQIDALMTLSPKKEKLEGSGVINEYKYSWKSVIRPLMSNMPATELYVSFSNTEPPYALVYGTDAPTGPPAAAVGPGWDADGGSAMAPSLEAPTPPITDQEDDSDSGSDEDSAGDSNGAGEDGAGEDDSAADAEPAEGGSDDTEGSADPAK